MNHPNNRINNQQYQQPRLIRNMKGKVQTHNVNATQKLRAQIRNQYLDKFKEDIRMKYTIRQQRQPIDYMERLIELQKTLTHLDKISSGQQSEIYQTFREIIELSCQFWGQLLDSDDILTLLRILSEHSMHVDILDPEQRLLISYYFQQLNTKILNSLNETHSNILEHGARQTFNFSIQAIKFSLRYLANLLQMDTFSMLDENILTQSTFIMRVLLEHYQSMHLSNQDIDIEGQIRDNIIKIVWIFQEYLSMYQRIQQKDEQGLGQFLGENITQESLGVVNDLIVSILPSVLYNSCSLQLSSLTAYIKNLHHVLQNSLDMILIGQNNKFLHTIFHQLPQILIEHLYEQNYQQNTLKNSNVDKIYHQIHNLMISCLISAHSQSQINGQIFKVCENSKIGPYLMMITHMSQQGSLLYVSAFEIMVRLVEGLGLDLSISNFIREDQCWDEINQKIRGEQCRITKDIEFN